MMQQQNAARRLARAAAGLVAVWTTALIAAPPAGHSKDAAAKKDVPVKSARPPKESGVDAARVAEIAAMLPPKPAGLGRPLADRAYWDTLARDKSAAAILRSADDLLKSPLPPWAEDRYLDFSRDGNRTRYQNAEFARRKRLAPLVLAECLTAKGTYLPAIRELIASLCAEKTWVLPAHDKALDNFEGRSITIDLFSAITAWQLAESLWLLGDRLDASVRARTAAEIERRVLEPFRQTLAGKARAAYWLNANHNWNAVCLANVVGAALSMAPAPEDRAAFVAAGEKYSLIFLSGFTRDGYCSEGVGYWNFGFGHYVMLSEAVRQATGGKLDLLARPQVRMPALFGHRIQIAPRLCPSFADCAVGSRPDADILRHVSLRLGLGLQEYETDLPPYENSVLDVATRIPLSQRNGTDPAAGKADDAVLGLRSYFDDIHVLIGRPAKASPCRLAVALKGGHNAEHHNHNDVGSYVLAVDGNLVLLDAGAETYTARTFSAKRYDSKLLNSYGHPVPLVAGQMQQPGRKSEAKVLRADFTDQADTFAIDLSSAYAVKELTSLQRTFIYSRAGTGRLTVADAVTFASPQPFGTALITRGKWQKLAPDRLCVQDGKQAVLVEIDAGGKAFEIEAEQIVEDAPVHPTRIGIRLSQPAAEATITVRITPR